MESSTADHSHRIPDHAHTHQLVDADAHHHDHERPETTADTAAASAQPPKASAPARVHEPPPVPVNQYTRRSDGDVLPGHFARIETGEHAGEIGVFETVVSNDPDGYPEVVEVTLRGSGQRVICPYARLTPTQFGGR